MKLNLNKHKFENLFLSKLGKGISRYYGKKVEFNIVNLKSIAHNADIFTEILTAKIKRRRTGPTPSMNALLTKVKFPEVNRIIERGRIEKCVNDELVENKYKNNSLSLIINKDDLSPVSLLPNPRGDYLSFGLAQATDSSINDQKSKTKDSLNQLLYNITSSETNEVDTLSVSQKGLGYEEKPNILIK